MVSAGDRRGVEGLDGQHGWWGGSSGGGSAQTGGARTLPGLPTLEGWAVTLACPGSQPARSTGVTDSQLAVLLRETQWALDEAAHDIPAGRACAQRRDELAGTLEVLAAIVRASAPDGAR